MHQSRDSFDRPTMLPSLTGINSAFDVSIAHAESSATFTHGLARPLIYASDPALPWYAWQDIGLHWTMSVSHELNLVGYRLPCP